VGESDTGVDLPWTAVYTSSTPSSSGRTDAIRAFGEPLSLSAKGLTSDLTVQRKITYSNKNAVMVGVVHEVGNSHLQD